MAKDFNVKWKIIVYLDSYTLHTVATTELALACGVCVYALYFTSMGVMFSVLSLLTEVLTNLQDMEFSCNYFFVLLQ